MSSDGISINEPSADAPARGIESADPKDKGKRSAESQTPSSRKRAHVEGNIPLIPATPESSNFDPILVFNNSFSFGATSQRDELAWASAENDLAPTVKASRYLLSMALRI